jgi:hypothetical protein
MYLKTKPKTKTFFLVFIAVLIICPLISQAFSLQITNTKEYTSFVHTNCNSQCNITYVDKPLFPVQINNNQIQIGKNWTVICPLQAGHNYHVYCYGTWVNISSAAKTDYDIYVYNPQGTLESSHTEAAGLPEHLGTTTNNALFTPSQSGNYSFVIVNNLLTSQGAQAATFMIIENLQCDQWNTCSLEGIGTNNLSSLHTCWAYEFVTNASTVALYINVPGTLDMYEARLYLMNNAQSPSINSFPLPWEQGLYGNLSGVVGGYNFESNAYRGVAYASCEYMGQSMYLNYTSSLNGLKLYHLVLIGEFGSGDIRFMLKSNFAGSSLVAVTSPKRVYPEMPTEIAYNSSLNDLESAQIEYTKNNWADKSVGNMEINGQICKIILPGQPAGTMVKYRISAIDVLRNSLNASGSYIVKEQPTLNITIVKDKLRYNENVTIVGFLKPCLNGSNVSLRFENGNLTRESSCQLDRNGSFTCSLKLPSAGTYFIYASSPETSNQYSCLSQEVMVTMGEPPLYVKYQIQIIAGLAIIAGIGGAVYYLKFRGK